MSLSGADPSGPRRFFLAGAPRARARLEDAGWRPTTRWDWDLYWRPQVPSLAAYASLRPGMRVNHFPGIGALTSPRLLGETLARAARTLAGRAGAPDHDLLWPELQAREATRTTSRIVLVSGVDPLRVYVHGAHAEVLEAVLRRIIVTTILAGRDALTTGVRDLLADRDACFEVLRFDFRIDATARVWLERVRLSPPLDDHPLVVDDTLALLGILPEDPSRSGAGGEIDLEERWCRLASTELARRGGYVRLVPSEEPSGLLRGLPLPRRSDLALAERLSPDARFDPSVHGVVPWAAARFVAGRLVLFSASTQRFYLPNETATYVWLRIEEAVSPDEIARELHARFAVPLAEARSDVWDIVARWAHEGLVGRKGDARSAASALRKELVVEHTSKALELWHPTRDGNTRRHLLLLDKLLVEHGETPTIMTEINDAYVRLPSSWTRMVVQGMSRWRAVRAAIHGGEDVEERMRAFDEEGVIGRRGARCLRPNRVSFTDWEHTSFVDDA